MSRRLLIYLCFSPQDEETAAGDHASAVAQQYDANNRIINAKYVDANPSS